jgi:pyruvate formate lyase activating enzyme
MKIGGLQRLSLIDFPGKLAAVVFTVGCNFRCPFCHNGELVRGTVDLLSEQSVFDFLETRAKVLDGVVVSGGEPTLQRDLRSFIEKIRALGFAVKLDTNGTHPEMLAELMENRLLDFVAMDIKHIWSRYNLVAKISSFTIEKIQRSVALLLGGAVDYEFRTTVIRGFHDPRDIVAMAGQIRGAKRYVVQEFIPAKTLEEGFSRELPFEKRSIEALIPEISANVQRFEIRQ